MKAKPKPSTVGRRWVLRLVASGLWLPGLLASGCARDCESAAPLDETARRIRAALRYVESSNLPGRTCRTCAQFRPGVYGRCGGCQLFAGGVHPDGVCASYVAARS